MDILRYHPLHCTTWSYGTTDDKVSMFCVESYFKSLEEWKKEPEKFNGRPRSPRYKKKRR